MSVLRILFLTVMVLYIANVNAQCDDNLVNKAIIESGNDALFIKEFKAKLKKGSAKRPERIAKFVVELEDSTKYRFNIANDNKQEGKVILQLFYKGKYLKSTYEFKKNIYNHSFDFNCKNTDKYQILMSFMDGKAGCALGIMSIVVNDSTEIDEKHLSEVLYLGLKNPLYIAYTEDPGCNLHVEAGQSLIEGENGKYTITPNKLGSLIIKAQVIDSLGNIIEKISTAFKVIKLPNPIVSINGNTGGAIFKDEIINAKGPELNISSIYGSDEYSIISFSLATKITDVFEIKSPDENFTYQQLKFIKELDSDSVFYLTNLIIKKPDGKIIKLNPIKYIIQ